MFRKNVQRESMLFGYWGSGHTVKETAILSDVPEGTISHYFSRFNRDKGKMKQRDGAFQEPPRSSPSDVAMASLIYVNVLRHVGELVREGKYSDARDYLQLMLLLMDFNKKILPQIQNYDPKEYLEIIKALFEIKKIFE